jgi:Lytic transglycolase/G5-linked-Ubiquitin-like domain
VRPSPARARPHDAAAWLPVPDVDTLPEIVQLLTPAPTAPPKPAEKHAPKKKPAPKAEPDANPAPRAKLEVRAKAKPARTERGAGIGRKGALAAVVPVVLLVAIAGYALPKFMGGGGASDPEVRLRVGNEITTVSTDVATVGALLEAEGVQLRQQDEVLPPLETDVTDGLTVVVTRAIPVTADVDGEILQIRSAAGSIAELKRDVSQLQGTKFVANVTDPVQSGDALERNRVYTFRTPRQIVTFIGPVPEGTPQETLALTVGEFLSSQGIVVADGDWVSPVLDAPIPPDGTTEIRFLTAAEYEGVGEFLDGPDVLVPIPLGAGGGTDCKGPNCGPVPGPDGLPIEGNMQVGDATYYEFTPGTCAHLTLPFGTVVTVTNVATGATATCTVADRGPEAWTGRIIDLTPGVFAQIAPLSQGVVTVEISW